MKKQIKAHYYKDINLNNIELKKGKILYGNKKLLLETPYMKFEKENNKSKEITKIITGNNNFSKFVYNLDSRIIELAEKNSELFNSSNVIYSPILKNKKILWPIFKDTLIVDQNNIQLDRIKNFDSVRFIIEIMEIIIDNEKFMCVYKIHKAMFRNNQQLVKEYLFNDESI